MPKWSKIGNAKKLQAVTGEADDDILYSNLYAHVKEYDTKCIE